MEKEFKKEAKQESNIIWKAKSQKQKNDALMQKYNLRLFLFLLCIVVLTTVLLSMLILRKTGQAMQSKVSALVSSTTHQQEINVDLYLQRISAIASLFFSDETYYKYDATSDALDDFEKIQKEKELLDRIQDLGVLENFSDFGVVYSNDHVVGWISDTTYKMYPEGGMYAAFAANITDDKTDSGWFSNFSRSYGRIYYVKRLNPNALLFTSFYSYEIESVFELPEEMESAVVRLVDENKVVLYSTKKAEIGKPLDESIAVNPDNKTSFMVVNKDYLITTSGCTTNQWSIVASMPTSVIFSEINSVRYFAYGTSLVMLIVELLFGLFIFKKVTEPINEMFKNLQVKANYDQLTGLLNKTSFQNMADALVDTDVKGAYDVFVMMDMDHFKTVNDTIGHDMGDKVLIRFSNIVKRLFGADVISGRVGGDEFALYLKIRGGSRANAEARLKEEIGNLLREFMSEFSQEHKSCNLSMSAGIVVEDNGKMTFEELYKAADTALYVSKNNGKNQFNFYKA